MRALSDIRFDDPAIEAAFIADYPQRMRKQLRIAFVIVIVAALVFLPQDISIDPANGENAIFVRLFGAVPLAGLGLLLTFWQRYDRLSQLYVSLLFAGLAVCNLLVLFFLDKGGVSGFGLRSSTGLSNVTLLIIFAFAVSTLRFRAATAVSCFIAICYFGFSVFAAGVDPLHFVSADFSNIILIMIVGLFIGITREAFLRREFYAMLRLEERFRDLVEGSIQGVLVHTGGRALFANRAFADILGFRDIGNLLAEPDIYEFIDEIDRDEVEDVYRRLMAGEPVASQHHWRINDRNGEAKWLDCLVRRVHWGDDMAVQFTVVDITGSKHVEEERRRLSQAIEQSPIDVLLVARDGIIEYVNGNFVRASGLPRNRVVGKPFHKIKMSTLDATEFAQIWKQVCEGDIWQGEVLNTLPSGDKVWEHILISPIRDEQGNVSQLLVASQDVSIRKTYEERLLHQAHYDQLTDLPNRILAVDRLGTAIRRAERNGEMVGVMFIDLDRFKKVNDMLGHNAGDEVIRLAAERLKACARDPDTIARLGGDEFAAILPDLHSINDVELVASRIVDAFADPFVIREHEVFITASIGITVYPLDGSNAANLMRHADAAMYKAKNTGRNGFQFFTQDLNAEIEKRFRLEQRLRAAIEAREFELHYQPQVTPYEEAVCGAEALIRWRNPDGSMESPADFIPLAEDTGLIVPIGRWVMQTAIDWIAAWREIGDGPSYVAVNVSPRQFREDGFVEEVLDMVAARGIPPEALELEVTENLLIDGETQIANSLTTLKNAGVRLSIDDFGTGYSALSYLKKFPFDTLKIDAAFVREVTENKDDQALIQAIIAMAHSLRLDVVAEGVETRAQLELMQRYECDVIQGFYFGKAMPADDFRNLFGSSGLADIASSAKVVPLRRD